MDKDARTLLDQMISQGERPPVPIEDDEGILVSVRLAPRTYAALNDAAGQLGVSPQSYAAMILSNWLHQKTK